MASNVYVQFTADGKRHLARRSVGQGRKPSGLAKPELVRLYAEDKEKMQLIKDKFGYLYNQNQLIRDAVHKAVESIYTELLNH